MKAFSDSDFFKTNSVLYLNWVAKKPKNSYDDSGPSI